MADNTRSDRILELIVRKVFGSLRKEEADELKELISDQDEDQEKWKNLMVQKNLIAYINEGNIRLPDINLDEAIAKAIEKIKLKK
jgi:hypothetical protein